jgi:hypothetical protein
MFKEELKKYKGLTDNGDVNTEKEPPETLFNNTLTGFIKSLFGFQSGGL